MKRLVLLLMVCILGLSQFSCNESGDSSKTPPQNTPNAPTPIAWTMATPAGISVASERNTVVQYNQHWQVNLSNEVTWKWEDIDWITLDEAFSIFKQFYCFQLGWDCKDVQPYELNVYIKPWDSRCVDAETPSQPYEIYEYINGGWNCIDGLYNNNNRTIYFHLGDDPGTDHYTTYEGTTTYYYAFEETSLSDELRHFFQWKAGRDQANNNDPTPPIHEIAVAVGYRIILSPEDSEEGEEETQ